MISLSSIPWDRSGSMYCTTIAEMKRLPLVQLNICSLLNQEACSELDTLSQELHLSCLGLNGIRSAQVNVELCTLWSHDTTIFYMFKVSMKLSPQAGTSGPV